MISGKYRCTAESLAGEQTAEAMLRVLTKPRIEELKNLTVALDSDIQLRCLVSGDPLPDVVFRKEVIPEPYNDGVNIDTRITVEQQVDDQGRRVGILRISALMRKDDGLYSCKGISSGGESEAWGHITVEFPPTFDDQPIDEFWSWEQKPVNLSCLATSIPNATIQWFVREEPIRAEDPNTKVMALGPNGILRVTPLDGSYFETYTCRASNTLGEADHDVVLKQVQKPGPVSSSQVEKITATTVSWNIRDPLDDGGRPVLGYTVQYRLDSTSWEKSEHKYWTKG
ncbi:unnamed protein product [Rotaria magnacalcarata]|uniref:Uncharacterized protein n=1 Tax=Rotaria magnacalcarata TaxID=392030 RepID=A0A819WPU1_9BILA|nr:unnamed protein product [Rotaria magnacalcarata]CAF4130019.1 unnamed protein product [Rotaria magnacalcarata]